MKAYSSPKEQSMDEFSSLVLWYWRTLSLYITISMDFILLSSLVNGWVPLPVSSQICLEGSTSNLWGALPLPCSSVHHRKEGTIYCSKDSYPSYPQNILAGFNHGHKPKAHLFRHYGSKTKPASYLEESVLAIMQKYDVNLTSKGLYT